MPWKLIAFLAILLVVTFFIGFNLDNRCDVSFIFYKYHDVPIFVSLLFAYAAGAVTVLPFFIGHGKKRAGKENGKASPTGGTFVRKEARSSLKRRASRKASSESPASSGYDED
ncbi:MAG TPA: hypothetical protein PK542_07575 [Treponemataceae bacterium]|nr:hypothetical protein [Treponemataceae bacterium]HPS44333.1 hypothetical protein [Treponemataceae bacterium]